MAATVDEILEALRATYWDAARREVCSMILFFSDVLDNRFNIENFLATGTSELDCDGFAKIVNFWYKFS